MSGSTAEPSSRGAVVRREFVRRFVFRDDVPRWRAHFYDADGKLLYDMRESDPLPPLDTWETCALPLVDMTRLAGGLETVDRE